jgi:hypothetical protein
LATLRARAPMTSVQYSAVVTTAQQAALYRHTGTRPAQDFWSHLDMHAIHDTWCLHCGKGAPRLLQHSLHAVALESVQLRCTVLAMQLPLRRQQPASPV